MSSITSTADQLLELIFSWIEERERLADNLRKLAKELESLREICNASECVGSTLKVVGAASMIGAGVATVFTGGLATPLMLFASASTGVGTTISVTTKITEHFLSCGTMKKVKNAEKKSNKSAQEIQQLFKKLKDSFAEPLAHHIMAKFLRAIARQSGLNVQMRNGSILNDLLQEFPLKMISDMHSRGAGGRGGSSSAGAGQRSEQDFRDRMGTPDIKGRGSILQGTSLLLVISFVGMMTLKPKGMKKIELLEAVKYGLRLMSTPGFQTTLIGHFMVFGGLAAMTYALPEMIDNWKEMIKGNHVTEASQSLRDTAYGIQKNTQTMKEEFNNIKKMLQEIEQEIQEIEEEENSEEETEDPPAVIMGLLNVRSIKKDQTKRLKIQKLITENNLDVFHTTETWLETDTADEALREASPLDFNFYQQSRDGRRGGGVAIQFSKVLQGQRIHFDFITTFEYVAAALTHDEWDEAVLFITVYRPPGGRKTQFKEFVFEFQDLLRNASRRYNSVIVAGDFNVHVENTHLLKTFIFDTGYQRCDFVQHLKNTTHQSGGILDLVFSRNVEISRVHIRDDGISDHSTIYFSIRPKSKKN